MREELELNRRRWDEATRLHTRGNVYGLEDFKAGVCRLHPLEVEEVGDVAGKRLLHLQCHFGLDTLSWARRGARVTGVDFSPEAIDFAVRLAAETRLTAEFVCSDLYALPQALQTASGFDIVYTSHGVLNWLPDLKPWARLVADYLKPGGFFYVVDAHPTSRIFPTAEDVPPGSPLLPLFSYFHDPAGIRFPPGSDYADESVQHSVGCHEWQHSLSDIVNALISAGLVLEWLHELPFCTWKSLLGCEVTQRFAGGSAYYALPASMPQIPLLFSLRARKPVTA